MCRCWVLLPTFRFLGLGWRVPGSESHVWVPGPKSRVPGPTFPVCLSKHRVKSFMLQKTKNSNIFDKNCTQENVTCHIQHEDLDWLKLTWMNRNWTGKLQVKLLSSERNCAHTLSKPFPKTQSWCIPRKWRQNTWKWIWKRVFLVNLQTGILQLHYRLTFSQIIFRDFKYLLRFYLLRMATCRSCIKCLKNTCEIVFYGI